MRATYSPEDNKLRLYPDSRLPADLYARVKEAGFSWAPKQELFVAPMWTPARADLLTEICEDGIEDEDTSLVNRAEQRAERFEDYSENRKEDAERARNAVSAITEHIPLGQPILVGHHSEKHARKDAQRIERGMDRAVKMWDQSQYWISRAKGAVRAAKYKERPDVRARRIKGLQADQRKQERNKAEAEQATRFWRGEMKTRDGAPIVISEEHRERLGRIVGNSIGFSTPIAPGKYGYWSAYDCLCPEGERHSECPSLTVAELQDKALAHFARNIEHAECWIAHITNRLAYEMAMLEDAGAVELLAKKPKSAAAILPLLNYKAASITCKNRYSGGNITYPQVEMTSAEYAAINKDYKGTNVCENSHRIRTAMVRNSLVSVFLTNSKTHEKPAPAAPRPPEPPRLAPVVPRRAPCTTFTPLVNGGDYRGTLCCVCGEKESTHNAEADKKAFEALREAAKTGVQVVSTPQLFPTPPDIAARVVGLAVKTRAPGT